MLPRGRRASIEPMGLGFKPAVVVVSANFLLYFRVMAFDFADLASPPASSRENMGAKLILPRIPGAGKFNLDRDG